MNYKISFKERAKMVMEMLSRQSPVTLEQARAQAKRLSEANQKRNNSVNKTQKSFK